MGGEAAAKAEAPASWSAITGRRARAEKPGPGRWRLQMPIGGLLIGMADAQGHGFVIAATGDLERAGSPPWHRLAAAAIVCGR